MYFSSAGSGVPSGSTTVYVYRTSNAGSTWEMTTVLISSNVDIRGPSICCTDDGATVFFVHVLGVYRSTNFGATFTLVNTTYRENMNIICNSDASYLYIPYTSNVNCVIYSTDQGVTFNTRTALPISGGSTFAISCSSNGQYILFAGSFSPCYVSTNYGQTATLLPTSDMPNNYFNNISVSDNGQYMMAFQYGSRIWKSSNYGVTGSWSVLAQSTISPGSNPSGATMSRSGQIIVVYCQSFINYSTNFGSTWAVSTVTPAMTSYESSAMPNKFSDYGGIIGVSGVGALNSTMITYYY
jgi:hypothetical protein